VKAASPRPTPRPDTRGPANDMGLLWPAWCLKATPRERQDALRRAAEDQGVLHDLPPVIDASGSSPSLVLHDLLSGHCEPLFQVPPHIPDNTTSTEPDLTPEQWRVAQCAANTPDLFLLQGLPGFGRCQVTAAILSLAALSGKRVLYVAQDAWMLDRALERVADATHVHAVRLLAPGEDAGQLPPATRALTPAARCEQLARQMHRHAAGPTPASPALQYAQLHLARWIQWRDKVTVWQNQHDQIEAWMAEHQGVADQVARERSAGSAANNGLESHLQAFAAENQRHQSRLAELDQQEHTAQATLAERKQDQEKWRGHVKAQEEVVELRKNRNWLSLSWWKAALHGRSEERLAEFRLRLTEAEQETQKAGLQLTELRQQLEIERQRHDQACEQILHDEVERRRTALEQKIQQMRSAQDAILREWREDGNSVGRLPVWAEQPTPLVVVQEIRRWEQVVQAEQTKSAQEAAQAPPPPPDEKNLRGIALRYANLVAAPWTALASELSNGAFEEPFDLLLCLQADRLHWTDFHALSGRARRWVWCGMPVSGVQNLDEADASPYAVLAHRLHNRPDLPHRVWREEAHTLCCELHTRNDEGHTQAEPLVDHPDILLHIHTPLQGKPVLQAVTFPKRTYGLPEAKRFLADNLGELPLSPGSPWPRWLCQNGCLAAIFAKEVEGPRHTIAWEEGITETVVASQSETDGIWKTARVDFAMSAGWNWAKAREWLTHHTELHDNGRSGFLTETASLATGMMRLLNLLLAAHRLPDCQPTTDVGTPAEEGRCVWWLPSHRGAAQDNGQSHNSSGGKRLIDLADSRQRQRLPHKLQAELPARGLVHWAEARDLVQLLERHFRNGLFEETPPSRRLDIAVLAHHQAQVSLIQALWRQTEWWDRQAPSVRFETVHRFRDQQADVVCVSLFRPNDLSPAAAFAEWLFLLTAARQHLLLAGELPGRTRIHPGIEGAFARFLDAVHACQADAAWLPADEGVPA
jgi:hypothetical protein